MRWMAIVAGLAAIGCAGETQGKLVQVAWEFEQSSQRDHKHFTTETGWDVSLDEARVAIGAVYAFAPAAAKQGAIAWLERCCVSVAHAHGGLDAESGRRVRAELLDPVLVDVLGSEAAIQPRDTAEAGALDGVKIELAAGGGELPGGASVYARGEAVREDQHVRFEAPVVLGSDVKARTVELTGLTASIDGDAQLIVGIDPSAWFQHCEFDRLDGGDEVQRVPSDNQVGRALVIGVRSPDAFGFLVKMGD